MTRLYGSDDLFPDDPRDAYRPYQSINFVTCHDGFTLYDLVSYDRTPQRGERPRQRRRHGGELQLELRLGGDRRRARRRHSPCG